MAPAARWAWVAWLTEALRGSKRHAGLAAGVHGSLNASRFRKPPRESLRAKQRVLATPRVPASPHDLRPSRARRRAPRWPLHLYLATPGGPTRRRSARSTSCLVPTGPTLWDTVAAGAGPSCAIS